MQIKILESVDALHLSDLTSNIIKKNCIVSTFWNRSAHKEIEQKYKVFYMHINI